MFFSGFWSTREISAREDQNFFIKTTIRELVLYTLFLVLLFFCKFLCLSVWGPLKRKYLRSHFSHYCYALKSPKALFYHLLLQSLTRKGCQEFSNNWLKNNFLLPPCGPVSQVVSSIISQLGILKFILVLTEQLQKSCLKR